ncbi:hypothetical protein GTY81_19910 [Streptomyces sp. SID8366]|uniref:transposase n=1 Tax=unclassified Streptomyces TaxID=2593676 RepID=UPI000DC55547|nr:transposase [Streptomyces sp. PsTaAH-130]MYU06102.1 hypothetical protein [Streptomyces sp. SID8366]MYU61675.1 hypothetical protein [Streptomyces sp. SID69]RAJ64170.1 hypothetical protein K376_01267 [Streptomyces sp. PsTaAH-130]
MKFTSLLANLVIFHNTLDIADVVRELQAKGRPDPGRSRLRGPHHLGAMRDAHVNRAHPGAATDV